MRDLHGRLAGGGVAIEREQPAAGERLDDGAVRDGEELAAQHPATPAIRFDEPQEELPRLLPPGRVERRVHLLGAAGDRARDAAQRAVPGERQRGAVAPVEQLGERELQQRQRGGLALGVGHQLRQQARLDLDADATGRLGDGARELLRPQRHDQLDAVAQHVGEPGVPQRPVEEVGPQRHDDADPAARIGRRGPEHGEEARAPLVVAEPGEELVELVHDEQELGVRAGEEVRGGTQEPVVVALDPLGEAGRRRGRREPHERRRQLTERVLAGRHLGDEDPG